MEDEDSEKVRVATVQLTSAHQQVDLTDVLRTLLGSMEGRNVKAYDFQRDAYTQINP